MELKFKRIAFVQRKTKRNILYCRFGLPLLLTVRETFIREFLSVFYRTQNEEKIIIDRQKNTHSHIAIKREMWIVFRRQFNIETHLTNTQP